MAARIVSIGTAVPSTPVAQDRIRDFFASQPGLDRLTHRLIGAAFDSAAIDQRHTALTQLVDVTQGGTGTAGTAGVDFVGDAQLLLSPTPGRRNDVYGTVAPGLSA